MPELRERFGPGKKVYPRFTRLPMGWAHAVRIMQVLHEKAVANRKKEPRQVLGLVTTKEKLAKGGNYVTSSDALSFLKSFDYSKCTQGMSGR